MSKPGTVLVTLFALVLSATLLAQETDDGDAPVGTPTVMQSETPQSDEIETVVVSGEYPGPGLWKVSRDGHVMWVLGSIGSVPETIVWRTSEVEAAIAQSQEVLYPGMARAGVDIGFFKTLTLIPALLKAAKNPNGARLQDVLKPEIYAKWRALKQQYLGKDDDVEKQRPSVAEDRLVSALWRKHKSPTREIKTREVVNKLAKKHKVKVRTLPQVKRMMEVKNPRAIIKAAQKVDFPEDECFDANLDLINQAIANQMFSDVTRVNAWAAGDLETLRNRPAVGLGLRDCMMEMFNAAADRLATEGGAEVLRGVDIIKQLSELASQATAAVERDWLAAAEDALSRNESTFAVLSVRNALSDTGYLAKLRERGYVVEEPN